MARIKNISLNPFRIPWFIWDLQNYQLITSPNIPDSDIKDSKQIIYSETPIPGLNFSPIQYGGGGNKKISFTIPLVKRDGIVGNIELLKQYENLRNQAHGLKGIFQSQKQFTPNPKVLYHWGSGASIPLEYYVTKCDFNQKSSFVNRFGLTQYSQIELELWLDELSPTYQAEEMFRKISSLSGALQGSIGTTATIAMSGREESASLKKVNIT